MTTLTELQVGPGIRCESPRCTGAEAITCLRITYSDGWTEDNFLCATHRRSRLDDEGILAGHDADARLMLLEHIPGASDEQLHELVRHATDRVVEMAAHAELQARMADRFQASYPDRMAR